MSFFLTLFRLCTRSLPVTELLRIRPLRFVFHVILMILLTTIIMTCFTVMEKRPAVERAYAAFQKETGGIELTRDHISARRLPARERSCVYPDLFRFDYYPGRTFSAEKVKTPEEAFGILCFNGGVTLWWLDPQGGDTRQALFIAAAQAYEICKMSSSDKSEKWGFLSDMMKTRMMAKPFSRICEESERLYQTGTPSQDKKDPGEPIRLENVFTVGEIMVSLGVAFFVFSLYEVIFLLVMSALVLGSVQYYWIKSLPVHPTYWGTVRLSAYHSFPAFLAASLLFWLPMPFLSFQMIFFLVFSYYQITAFRQIAAFRN